MNFLADVKVDYGDLLLRLEKVQGMNFPADSALSGAMANHTPLA